MEKKGSTQLWGFTALRLVAPLSTRQGTSRADVQDRNHLHQLRPPWCPGRLVQRPLLGLWAGSLALRTAGQEGNLNSPLRSGAAALASLGTASPARAHLTTRLRGVAEGGDSGVCPDVPECSNTCPDRRWTEGPGWPAPVTLSPAGHSCHFVL